jgi:aminomethyltransferase
MDSANLRTPLYDTHVALGGRMVPFGGWDMPVQYPSGILAEVRAVRTGAGIFDVSHMGRVYISGPSATDFLDWALTGSATTLAAGRARYCMICNERGGVIDDTIFYRLAQDRYLLIPNAGNRHRVLDWFGQVIGQRFAKGVNLGAHSGVSLDDQTLQTSLLACQGPAALGLATELAEGGLSGLRPFAWTEARMCGADVLVGRTGYTGEDGVEVLAPASAAPAIWAALTDAGAVPCGLGARDVLRTEAGLPLHGHELDEATTPVEARLERFVDFDKDFVGRDALLQQRENGTQFTLVGLQLPGRSAPRATYTLSVLGFPAGQVTSGCYSPTLDTSLGMGYVFPEYSRPGTVLEMDKRGLIEEITVTTLPHYRRPRPSRARTPS